LQQTEFKTKRTSSVYCTVVAQDSEIGRIENNPCKSPPRVYFCTHSHMHIHRQFYTIYHAKSARVRRYIIIYCTHAVACLRSITYYNIKISKRQRLVVHDDLWNVSRNGYGILLGDHLIFYSIFFLFIYFSRNALQRNSCIFFRIAGGSQFKNTFQNGIGFRIKIKKNLIRLGCCHNTYHAHTL